MMELSVEKFKQAVEYLKKVKKIKKDDVAKELGYKGVNNLSMITSGKNKLTMDIILKFCEKFPEFKIKDFYADDSDNLPMMVKDEKRMRIKVKEEEKNYPISTIENRLNNIHNQIVVINKTNEMLKQLLLSGIELSDAQFQNMDQLRNLIGH